MASARYTINIKPEDIQPDAPRPELTPREKRENFWFYHKWHVIGGALAFALVFSLVWEIVTQVKPDYTVGLLSSHGLPTGIGEVLGERLAPCFDDRNGDGRVVVSVVEYTVAHGDTLEGTDPNVQMASMTKLMGDLDMGESMLFLTDDLEYFEEQYYLFAYNDGTAPEEGTPPDYSRMGVRWGDCPMLTALELGSAEDFAGVPGIDYQAFLQDFRLVQRIVVGTKVEKDEDAIAYHAASVEKFEELTRR